MKTGKRLIQYSLFYKKILICALLMLVVAVSAELTGPFIAKKMIDEHILGIEKTWYEVSEKSKYSVSYKGREYVREDRMSSSGRKRKQVHIFQIGMAYYFVDEAIQFDGERTVMNGRLRIQSGTQSVTYPTVRLSPAEVYSFYEPEVGGIVSLVLLYFGLLIFSIFFHYGQVYLLQKSANRIIQKMRKDVFANIQKLPIPFFDHLPAGKIVARVTNDTEAIRDLYVTVLSTFVSKIIYMVGIFIALFILDVRLATVCLVVIPLIVIWSVVYRRFAAGYNHKLRSINSDINAKVNESIQGMTIIQAFRRQKETMRDFEQLNNSHFHYQNKMLSLNCLLSHNLVNFLRNGMFVALIWYFGGAALNAEGVISIGVLYAFVDYLTRLIEPINGIVSQFAKLELARVSAERVFQLLDEPGVEVTEKSTEKVKGHVVFENVSFRYDQGHDVLKNISFEAKPGETIALVGHTGSGKSSILNVLFRFYDIRKGDVKIDGKSIYDVSQQQIRQYLGIVLQDPFLFTGTIASNVSLGNEEISREKIEDALKQVGADQWLTQLRKGLDEPVIEKGGTLSSGQRQLISFARALAYDPAILILDEATANIDSETEAIIQKALDVVKKGRTTFIIAHRLSTIRNANQILVLDNGNIIEQGNHEQLIKQKGQYYQMYELQKGEGICVG
ncbi:ABC transporter ATP-binding protein [Bacillus sp. WMMC1349]|uniref:ABC transporter ATP-binding protein n=1 Tax=Bacillus sp. WMMC1349 TaxID=2736254 RepID=UPI0015580901|nr:ABC transporter ATP-binding protein [Bacillus sp. WMMC1349]NPC92039.1 ABC transporter ATP-binding protein [Bacillus sp. WMMC1349]